MGCGDVGWEQSDGVGPNHAAFLTKCETLDAQNSTAVASRSAGWQQDKHPHLLVNRIHLYLEHKLNLKFNVK